MPDNDERHLGNQIIRGAGYTAAAIGGGVGLVTVGPAFAFVAAIGWGATAAIGAGGATLATEGAVRTTEAVGGAIVRYAQGIDTSVTIDSKKEYHFYDITSLKRLCERDDLSNIALELELTGKCDRIELSHNKRHKIFFTRAIIEGVKHSLQKWSPLLWDANSKREPAEALLENGALQYFPLDDVTDLAQFIANSKPPVKNMWPAMLNESNRTFSRKVESICRNLEKIKGDSSLPREMKEAFDSFSKSNLLNNLDEYESFDKKLEAVDNMLSFFSQDTNLVKLREICSYISHDDAFADDMKLMHDNIQIDSPDINYNKEDVDKICLAYYEFFNKMLDTLPLITNGMIDLQSIDKAAIGKSISDE